MSIPDDDCRILIDENVNNCAICLSIVLPVETLSILPCSHYYHTTCLDVWLKNRSTCPQCRKIVKETKNVDTPSIQPRIQRQAPCRRNKNRILFSIIFTILGILLIIFLPYTYTGHPTR